MIQLESGLQPYQWTDQYTFRALDSVRCDDTDTNRHNAGCQANRPTQQEQQIKCLITTYSTNTTGLMAQRHKGSQTQRLQKTNETTPQRPQNNDQMAYYHRLYKTNWLDFSQSQKLDQVTLKAVTRAFEIWRPPARFPSRSDRYGFHARTFMEYSNSGLVFCDLMIACLSLLRDSFSWP